MGRVRERRKEKKEGGMEAAKEERSATGSYSVSYQWPQAKVFRHRNFMQRAGREEEKCQERGREGGREAQNQEGGSHLWFIVKRDVYMRKDGHTLKAISPCERFHSEGTNEHSRRPATLREERERRGEERRSAEHIPFDLHSLPYFHINKSLLFLFTSRGYIPIAVMQSYDSWAQSQGLELACQPGRGVTTPHSVDEQQERKEGRVGERKEETEPMRVGGKTV
ncbi:unnamed protein product [Pleuronectes platessa]|uniref:Uncharacterized protein n=1 Tax=Pleuronectes platessa TaxID=8262 RepID=A0A9N7TW51_PLEPL|nr:unnamed protein product [Pleuronectes platessa]